MTVWIPRFRATLVILGVSLLVACAGGANREEIAQLKFQAIPQLADSELIASISGLSGGSSETCYGGYVEALYGTDLSQTEVIGFYYGYARDNQWIDESSSNDWQLGAIQQEGDYFFGMRFIAPRNSLLELYPTRVDPKVVDKSLSDFRVVYLVKVSYYPNRRSC